MFLETSGLMRTAMSFLVGNSTVDEVYCKQRTRFSELKQKFVLENNKLRNKAKERIQLLFVCLFVCLFV